VSQLLAYWANHRIFDRVNEYAKRRGYEFSLYVDDITLSTDAKLSRKIHITISRLLRANDLRLKRKKIQYFRQGQDRVITGVLIKGDGLLRAPNKLKKKFFAPLKKRKNGISNLAAKEARSSLGRANAIKYIDGKGFHQLHTTLSERVSRLDSGR